jgi:predicted secreted protein
VTGRVSTERCGLRAAARHACRTALTVALLAWGMHAANADSETHYNRVQLQAQQTESVGNDTMHVSLNSSGEADDPATLAARINESMAWALEIAKRYEGITVATGGYRTYPVYKDNALRGWRGEQSLELEGRDSRDISRLVGELQDKLQVSAMSFSVSHEKRTEVENRLIGQALDAFKARAAIVVSNLRASGYRIVDISIGTASQRPPVPYLVGAMAAPMKAESRVAVESGESDISVSISGTVELTLP